MVYHKSMIIIYSILSINAYPLTVGTNTTVTRQATSSLFPSNSSNNEIRGFIAMEVGFSLQNAATTCAYNAFFPVGSNIILNGGGLKLFRNLPLDSNALFTTGGLIDGFAHEVSLPNKIGIITLPNGLIFNNTAVFCNSDLALAGPLRFNGSSILDGQMQTLSLGALGSLVTGTGATLLLRDITIKNVKAGNFFCVDNAGTVSFDNVTLILDNNYSFTQGHLDVMTTLEIQGNSIFAYQSSVVSTIMSNASLLFDSGMTFSYVPPIASGALLVLTDTSATLQLYETTLYSTPTGMQLSKGNLVIDGICNVLSDARVVAEGIIFGDGVNSANDLTISVMPESGLNVVSGYLIYNNVAG